MRTVVVKDTKIPKDELLAMLDDYSDFMEEHTGIKPVFWVEQRDFSSVPTKVDDDGDMKPTNDYLRALSKDVESRYGEAGTDNVVMLVHEDNFLYRGIWGQNWSFSLGSYSLQLCRWDRDNVVNSFNTFFHEGGPGHSADAVLKKELNLNLHKIIEDWIMKEGKEVDKQYIEKLRNAWVKKNINKYNRTKTIPTQFNWDRDYIHGALPSVQYMGGAGYTLSDNNLSLLKVAAPYLKKAYKVREDRHLKKIGLMEQIVKIVSTLISLLQKKK